jgi:hypothetical protein
MLKWGQKKKKSNKNLVNSLLLCVIITIKVGQMLLCLRDHAQERRRLRFHVLKRHGTFIFCRRWLEGHDQRRVDGEETIRIGLDHSQQARYQILFIFPCLWSLSYDKTSPETLSSNLTRVIANVI